MPCYIGGPVDLQSMTVVHDRCIPGGIEVLEVPFTVYIHSLNSEEYWSYKVAGIVLV